MDTPTKGRIVTYILGEDDAKAVNRRRLLFTGTRNEKFSGDHAQVHVGNEVHAGEEVPAMIVAVFNSGWNLNLQCFLDGSDHLWVTSRPEGITPGSWYWPNSSALSRAMSLKPNVVRFSDIPNPITQALDIMAVLLTDYEHKWSPEQRRIYENAVEIAKTL